MHMDLHNRLHRRPIPIRPRLPHTGGSNTPAKPLANSDPQQDLAARDIPLGLRATVLAIPMLGRSTTLLCLLPNLNRTAEMVITQWQVSRLILKMSKATRSNRWHATDLSHRSMQTCIAISKPRGCKRYSGNSPFRLAHPKMLKTDPTKSLKSGVFLRSFSRFLE